MTGAASCEDVSGGDGGWLWEKTGDKREVRKIFAYQGYTKHGLGNGMWLLVYSFWGSIFVILFWSYKSTLPLASWFRNCPCINCLATSTSSSGFFYTYFSRSYIHINSIILCVKDLTDFSNCFQNISSYPKYFITFKYYNIII